MKIRNGFVSNSSSSSFIISTESFKSIKDLATYMINKQIEESRYEDYKDPNNDYIQSKLTFIKALDKIDENQPISFPSCNYDTYIKKVGDCYLVSTCNNTNWDLYEYSTRLTDNAREKLESLKELYCKNSDEYNQIESILDGDYYEFSEIGNDYYALDKEFIGVETYDSCPNEDKIEHPYNPIWNTQKYGKVCIVCSPYFKRKEKLEKLDIFIQNED